MVRRSVFLEIWGNDTLIQHADCPPFMLMFLEHAQEGFDEEKLRGVAAALRMSGTKRPYQWATLSVRA